MWQTNIIKLYCAVCDIAAQLKQLQVDMLVETPPGQQKVKFTKPPLFDKKDTA